MLLSPVYVLVVAQSSSEIPEGLMNNPVLYLLYRVTKLFRRPRAANAFYQGLILFSPCIEEKRDNVICLMRYKML